jgi:hypothetical protein
VKKAPKKKAPTKKFEQICKKYDKIINDLYCGKAKEKDWKLGVDYFDMTFGKRIFKDR